MNIIPAKNIIIFGYSFIFFFILDTSNNSTKSLKINLSLFSFIVCKKYSSEKKSKFIFKLFSYYMFRLFV